MTTFSAADVCFSAAVEPVSLLTPLTERYSVQASAVSVMAIHMSSCEQVSRQLSAVYGCPVAGFGLDKRRRIEPEYEVEHCTAYVVPEASV